MSAWTTTRPAKEGWYWWREDPNTLRIVRIFRGRRFWHIEGFGRLSSRGKGEWQAVVPPNE